MPTSTFPTELAGKLWHTTNESRFEGIGTCGYIVVEPDIPDTDRWKSAAGREHYPYVRWIGGISLFDFSDFDPESYEAQFPLSSWRTFVPFQKTWRNSLWIEIDRAAIAPNFLSGQDVLARRRSENAYGHDFMPNIEAACLAGIPVSAFRQVLIRGSDSPTFRPYVRNVTTRTEA